MVKISFHFARNAARLHQEESNCPYKFRNFVVKIKIIEISRVLDPCRVAEISQNAITPRVLISENDFPTSNWHTELNKTNFFVT